MIHWTPYPSGRGEWVEVNGLRLIAWNDGSWSVQWLDMSRFCITSPERGLRVLREWTLETAKQQAEQAAQLMEANNLEQPAA